MQHDSGKCNRGEEGAPGARDGMVLRSGMASQDMWVGPGDLGGGNGGIAQAKGSACKAPLAGGPTQCWTPAPQTESFSSGQDTDARDACPGPHGKVEGLICVGGKPTGIVGSSPHPTFLRTRHSDPPGQTTPHPPSI